VIVWAIIAIFVMEYVRPQSLFPPLGMLKLNSLIPLGTYAYSLFFSRKESYKFLRTRESKLLMTFALLMFLHYFFADVTMYVHRRFTAVIGYIITFYLLEKELDGFRKLDLFLRAFVIIHTFIVFLNLDLFLRGDRSEFISSGSFLGDGNDFGLALNVALPLAMYYIFHGKGKMLRITMTTCAVFMLIGIIGLASRGAIVALVMVLGYFIFWSRRFVLGIALVIFTTVIVSLFASQLFFERMATLRDYSSEGSASARLDAWQAGLHMAIDHPLTGVGVGHFFVAYGKTYRNPNATGPWMNAHSMYFQTLGETGLPGFALYLAILATGYFGVGAIRAKKGDGERAPPTHDLALFVRMSWVAFIINGAFLSVAYYPHVFVLCGISSALIACHGNIGEPRPAKPSRRPSQAPVVRWSRREPGDD
jgi:probable O-glycosylation ligase (exosortase A-associated)